MKYWRRHKHELEGVSPVVPRPEKKKKYDFKDDLLLAKYFVQKPVGTSDSIFQAFARDVRSINHSKDLLTHSSSIRTIPGKAGKNIIEFTKQRSIISSNKLRLANCRYPTKFLDVAYTHP
jgi:hypothetical protein